ncbi:MAG: FGGY-family carbohydrate kinase [bacterium]
MSLLGIDVGTSGCKAAAFSADGRRLAMASREYPTLHPGPGLAELDSNDVWEKTRAVIAEVCAAVRNEPVTALCVSSLGEAVVPVSRDRRLLGSSILSSDPRGAEYADTLRREIGQDDFYRINPNILGPQYSLPKLMWLRDHDPRLFAGADMFLLWSDVVNFMLGCEPTCNNSHANRTLLFDLDANDWSDRLLKWAGMERSRFGRVVAGGTVVGTVADRVADELGMPRGVTVVAGGHDQCPNALGCGCIEAGSAVCGIGTYECLTPVFAQPADPLSMLRQKLNMEHHVLPGLYVAFLFNQSGSLVRWFRDTFAVAEAKDADVYARLNAELPSEPTRLLVLPHFDPPPWPEYIPDTAGAIVGLKTETRRGEILKAIMEGATFHFVDGIDALRRIGVTTAEFVASGGGARSDEWLQIKADIFGVPFVRLHNSEGGLAGAAMLAGLATGVFKAPKDAVATFVRRERVFEPDSARHAIYREKHALYRQLFPALRPVLNRL